MNDFWFDPIDFWPPPRTTVIAKVVDKSDNEFTAYMRWEGYPENAGWLRSQVTHRFYSLNTEYFSTSNDDGYIISWKHLHLRGKNTSQFILDKFKDETIPGI